MGLAATRTRGLSHVYLGTLSENHTTRPQDRTVVAVVAVDESLIHSYYYKSRSIYLIVVRVGHVDVLDAKKWFSLQTCDIFVSLLVADSYKHALLYAFPSIDDTESGFALFSPNTYEASWNNGSNNQPYFGIHLQFTNFLNHKRNH